MEKPSLYIIHKNEKKDGSALKIEMHYQTTSSPGYITFSFANQNGENIDFDNRIDCNLGFEEITKVIQMLEGETDGTDNDKPIETEEGIKFAMKHIPEKGYAFAAMRNNGDSCDKSQILVYPNEATGIRHALCSAMFFIAFIRGINT